MSYLISSFLIDSLGINELRRGEVSSFNLESAMLRLSSEHSGD